MEQNLGGGLVLFLNLNMIILAILIRIGECNSFSTAIIKMPGGDTAYPKWASFLSVQLVSGSLPLSCGVFWIPWITMQIATDCKMVLH
jgi:hypothetical protein